MYDLDCIFQLSSSMSIFLTIIIILATVVLLFPVILHLAYQAPRVKESATPKEYGLPYSEHRITTVKNKQLFAWMMTAENSCCTLVIVHGWGANAEMMLPLAQPFHAAGMDVLVYDARNHGQSDSDSFSSLPRFAEDLGKALEWLQQRSPEHQVVVLGHSVGAAASILTASRGADIDLVISVSGFAHPRLMMNRHLDRPWLPSFFRPMIINYVQWVIGFRFDDIAPMNRIPHVRCPVLLAHGTADTTVPIEDMHLIAASATTERPVEVVAVEGAKHDSVEHFKQHADKLIKFVHDKLQSNR
jgi:alpha-beta hydrolase superfamily lysophospholipase